MWTSNGDYSQLSKRDVHIHTLYCGHARGTMEDYIRVAIQRNFEEIGFLAHAEAGIRHPRKLWLEDAEYDAYWREGSALKARYQDRIVVTLGLEIGLNPRAVAALLNIMERYPWDRTGLSYHQLRDGEAYLNICSRQSIPRLREMDSLPLVLQYYQDLRDHISIFKPHMICHLDVVRKYMQDCSHDIRVQLLVKEVLAEMQRHRVKLEVNTSGYDTVGAPYPAPWIIHDAVEMGIQLVLTSDSHSPEHVGRHFPEALGYIERAVANGTWQ